MAAELLHAEAFLNFGDAPKKTFFIARHVLLEFINEETDYRQIPDKVMFLH
jgi:hypothetical protein